MVEPGLLGAGGGVEYPRRPSPLPVATRVPSGLNATAFTAPSWSSRASSAPVAASNTRAEPSPLPVATRVPSGLNATAFTEPSWSSRASSAPVAASNTRADPSPLAVATRVPSGLNATAYTAPSWSSRTSSVPVAASNTRADPSLAGGGDPGAVRAERHRVHRAVVVEPGQLGPGRPRRTPAPTRRGCRWRPGCRPG